MLYQLWFSSSPLPPFSQITHRKNGEVIYFLTQGSQENQRSSKNSGSRSSHVVQQDQWHLCSSRMHVQSLAQHHELKNPAWRVDHNCGLNLIPGPGTQYATGQPKRGFSHQNSNLCSIDNSNNSNFMVVILLYGFPKTSYILNYLGLKIRAESASSLVGETWEHDRQMLNCYNTGMGPENPWLGHLFFQFFFLLLLQHVEVPGPGIESVLQQWSEPQQWQCQILNLMSHQGTPGAFPFCCPVNGLYLLFLSSLWIHCKLWGRTLKFVHKFSMFKGKLFIIEYSAMSMSQKSDSGHLLRGGQP